VTVVSFSNCLPASVWASVLLPRRFLSFLSHFFNIIRYPGIGGNFTAAFYRFKAITPWSPGYSLSGAAPLRLRVKFSFYRNFLFDAVIIRGRRLGVNGIRAQFECIMLCWFGWRCSKDSWNFQGRRPGRRQGGNGKKVPGQRFSQRRRKKQFRVPGFEFRVLENQGLGAGIWDFSSGGNVAIMR
jgi:hypothetical protein